MENKEKEKLIEEYGTKLCKIMEDARYTSIGGCSPVDVKNFAEKCFRLGEEFGSKK